MDLITLQRQLRALIKSDCAVIDEADPYIRRVAESKGLPLVREIVTWWRAFGLEKYCVLTTAVLKRSGLFDDAVQGFVRGSKISPYIEKLGPSFLEQMIIHEDRLVATVARFELALVNVKRGDLKTYVIQWEYEPYAILNALIKGLPISEQDLQGSYRTVVSHELPNLFCVDAVFSVEGDVFESVRWEP